MLQQIRRRWRHTPLIWKLAGILLLVLIFLFGINRWKIEAKNPQDGASAVDYQSAWDAKDARAYLTGSILRFVKIPAKLEVTGTVDTGKLGDYTVHYTAHRFLWRMNEDRVISVKDLSAPVITLVTKPDSYTLPGKAYEEEGYSAVDAVDGDVTDKVQRKEEAGVVTYTVTDNAGNTATKTRQINYDDKVPPVITLVGGDKISVALKSKYEDKYSAVDNVDGDITDKVQVEGTVDTDKEGSYTLTYSVTDAHNNTTTCTRQVTVSKDAPSDVASEGTDTPTEGKIIYLTFDDGPGKYTGQLLDILKKYNVKVTFFTTNQFPHYQDLLTREANEGHTVAIHSYTHIYSQVYASTDNYWTDYDQMKKLIEEKTGKSVNLFRFPGGSSNAISKKYTAGIMTQLVEQAKEKGYTYADWNVSSGDGGEVRTSQAVYDNCVRGVSNNRVSVILCHDIKDFTVNSMDGFISWALQNGYTFLPMTEHSFPAHHGHINN